MTHKITSKTFLAITATYTDWLKISALAFAMLATVLAFSNRGEARDQTYPIFQVGGNQFIIRKLPAGPGKIYLYAYRLAGDQWERYTFTKVNANGRHRGNSIPEQIYRNGRKIGTIRVDLDNPLNTDLNMYPDP